MMTIGKAHRAAGLFLLLYVSSCAKAGQIIGAAVGGIVECVRNPKIEREAREALNHDDAGERLDAMAGSSGWDIVKCSVESIVRSLTGARQDGELGAQSSEWKATRDDLQPVVDRARSWLRKKDGTR